MFRLLENEQRKIDRLINSFLRSVSEAMVEIFQWQPNGINNLSRDHTVMNKFGSGG